MAAYANKRNGSPGPYCPLGAIDTVPRAYYIFRACKEMEGEKIKIKK
jgi:hypothetical protein